MEMQFKNEIKKLADVVVWADNLITAAGFDVEKYKNDAASVYCHVKAHELWKIKTVVLEAIDRHTAYTNALNKDIADKAAKIDLLEKEIEGRKEGYFALKTQMDRERESINYWSGMYAKVQEENEELKKDSKTHYDMYKYGEELLKVKDAEIENLKKELEETYRTKEADLKNHNKMDMTLVDELAKKNDEIKELKEENSYLKSEIKQKQGIISKAYERYSNEIIKTRKDVLEVAYRDIEKDNGYVGFKLYVKNALIEAKGNKNEANEVITDAVKFCFNEWDKTQKENEKTIKKAIEEVMNKKFGYAWKIVVRLRSEVDKKRIVDISEGAEKILGVSRELFDAAIKALVDDGYQEIIGRIPQATNSYVYMDMHVLATPDVETKDAANHENIKSLDSGIPCGEDSIE